MARFKQVKQAYISKNLIRFWINLVLNFDGEVTKDDFFEVVCRCFEHDKAVELITTALPEDELKSIFGVTNDGEMRLDLDCRLDGVFRRLWNRDSIRTRVKLVLGTIGEISNDYFDAPTKPERIERRFNDLVKGLQLNKLEADLALLAYIERAACFNWPCNVNTNDKALFYAMALDRQYGEVLNAMASNGRLRRYSVLDSDWDFNRHAYDRFLCGYDDLGVVRRFYRKLNDVETLPWEFYGELATEDGELIRKIIAASTGKKNILLYGAPGTGKTSFARTLAKEVGLDAFEIKQGEEKGAEMTSESRMVGIRLCNEREDAKKSIMIIDEADALLRNNARSEFDRVADSAASEKGVINTLLDEMRMPAIWISNVSGDQMAESVRRRFDYSICFERLNTKQRKSIWRNVVRKLALENVLSEEKLDGFATRYATSAGGIAIVMENAKSLGLTSDNAEETIEKLMRPHCKLMSIAESSTFLPAKGYSLEGLNIKGDVKPDRILKAVGNYLDAEFNENSEDKPRMNILMYGAPGTGKTEFVKYLGKMLGRKVMVKKASDILNCYVGESEQNIARSFRKAESEGAILFFDEIDGLVRDRSSAYGRWEVTQTNELLQQMENFGGVMVAATNLRKDLDAAIMRRFTFKLEFDYLDDDGKRLFFERMFKTRLTADEYEKLSAIPNLAPGDFRTVRQKIFYLDDAKSNLARIEALREECALKPDGTERAKIGFGM